jgi:hypothetical protein
MLIRYAVRQDKKPSTDKSERNIKAYLYMKVVANVGNETANVWMSFKEDDNGAFLYEEFVNKKAMSGIARVTSTP